MAEKKSAQPSRVALGVISLLGLALVYVFQQINYFHIFCASCANGNSEFIVNRTVRLLLNDLLSILLIYSLFEKRKYIRMASVILAIELFVILPIYFWVKLSLEGNSEISSPLLSQIHRLVVNPMLMFILIAGFYYQKYFLSSRR
jgi:exosortase F-associated protein